ncbi:hypothetical protein BCR33DRAFT_859096 [Rhizoclosmatium globosum]|uniref:C3H1-type domain-containing protein n=1 Tax=Rhizoclosmatium globosum TaxID=329046 RepID=A0A1Y2AVE0_9FUNG|nr:hypothetical protein BCR33DRAFT_859096 [Rhizoclosmatium globosum]|eukprot:ORY26414.1 hypothetical protein BCR33DRAFT_859096 [Rhizoclosmatium globosum]
MFLTDEETNALQQHLVTVLEPVCDADPTVLAEYVVALLKHERSDADLEQSCIEQLDEFLRHETRPFVSKLFKALADKSYLNQNQTQAQPVEPVANTTIGGDAKRRRSDASEHLRDDDDDEDNLRSRRRRRGGSEDPHSAQFNQHNNNNVDMGYNRGRGGFRNQQQPYGMHPQQMGNQWGAGGFNQMPFNPSFSQQFNNNSMRGGFGQQQRPGFVRRKGRCFEFDSKGFCSRAEACPYDHTGGPMGNMGGPGPMGMMGGPVGPSPMMGPGAGMNRGPNPMGVMAPGFIRGGPVGMPFDGAQQMNGSNDPPQFNQDPMNTPDTSFQQPQSFRGAFRGGSSMRGSFRGGFNQQTPYRRPGETITIQNIPPESCTLDTVNTYFKQFGTITDIKIDIPNARAVIRYSSPSEAKAAHTSPDVIFGNRFVKVFYGDATEPTPTAPTSTNPQPNPTPNPAPHSTTYINPSVPTPTSINLAKQELKAKRDSLLAQHLSTQKELLAKLESKTLTPTAKSELMASLKSVNAIVKGMLEEGQKAVEAAAAKKQAAEEAAAAGVGGGEGDDLEELERLKAVAAEMGVDPEVATASAAPVGASGPVLRGGYHGRGGFRGGRGGRGGYGAPVTRSLDLRPKKLVVKGVRETEKALLMSQLEPLGRVTMLDFHNDEEKLVLEMAFRHESEKVLAVGLKGANAESLPVSWFDANAPAVSAAVPGENNAEESFAS